MEVEQWIPAARHAEHVARDGLVATVGQANVDRAERAVHLGTGAGHDGVGVHDDARGTGGVRQRARRLGSWVNHAGDVDASRLQLQRGAVGIIVGGEDCGALRDHCEPVEVAA